MRACFSALLLCLTGIVLFGGCAISQKKSPVGLKIGYQQAQKDSREVVWPDKDLEKAFEKYWSFRLSGLWEDTWEMEAPYFREMAPAKKYENIIKAHGGAKESNIDIAQILQETDNLAVVHCEVTQKINDAKKSYFLRDRWVLVQEKWYHVIADPILFPSVK